MEIRRIGVADAALVIGLFDLYRQFYKQASDTATAEKFIKERLENNESVIFVAVEDNVPLGFTQLYPKYSSMRASKNWILNDLYVENSHRKKGIGEALIKTAMNFAKGTGATFVQLETALITILHKVYTSPSALRNSRLIRNSCCTVFLFNANDLRCKAF